MTQREHSPSEYYIKYLLSESGLDDQETIRKHLNQLGLDPRGRTYIERLDEELGERPDPYRPEDPSHYPTVLWLKQHRIHDMWRMTPAVQEAVMMLDDLPLRDKLHPLLLSSLAPTDIIRHVRKFTRLRLTRRALLLYSHYFWNKRIMSQSSWVRYLRAAPGGDVCRAGLTLSPDVSKAQLPHLLGLSGPPAWQGPDAIARVAQIAYSKVLRMEHEPPGPDDARALRAYTEVMHRADEIMQRSGSAIQEVLQAFQSFKMRTDERPKVDIQELSGGNYSGSGEGTGVDEK